MQHFLNRPLGPFYTVGESLCVLVTWLIGLSMIIAAVMWHA